MPLRRTQPHLCTLSGVCFCVASIALRVPGVLLSLKLVLFKKNKGQGPGLVNVLSQREWLRVDQFQHSRNER